MSARGRLRAAWDDVVGPGASARENTGTLTAGLAGALLAPRLAAPRAVPAGSSGTGRLDDVVLRLLALDLWGGVWCNNTPSAVRWYHRPGHGPGRRLLFCALHLHPFVVALLDERRDGRPRWRRACAEHAYVLLAAAVVEAAPVRARRAAGLLATAGGVVLDRALGGSPSAPWFAPVHVAKLLAGHVAGGALGPSRRPGPPAHPAAGSPSGWV
ncbi:hypothetical protein [Kineococcus sp. SYSU DK004]|uniref:hypothetical protein n=1 Tax=Kineococcus sp. SYSU DK004 TaxID=3383125 RepID=UPI003D7CA167